LVDGAAPRLNGAQFKGNEKSVILVDFFIRNSL
jgi:hypothetical protein